METDSGTLSTAVWKGKFMGGSRGGQGVRTPFPEKSHKYRVISNTGLDPLKNHKATKPAFNVGPSSASGPMMALF